MSNADSCVDDNVRASTDMHRKQWQRWQVLRRKKHIHREYDDKTNDETTIARTKTGCQQQGAMKICRNKILLE
jgi:hypothetical protein